MCTQLCGDWGSSKRRRLAVSDLTLMPTNQRVRDLDTCLTVDRQPRFTVHTARLNWHITATTIPTLSPSNSVPQLRHNVSIKLKPVLSQCCVEWTSAGQ